MVEELGIKRVITFHHTTKRAREFAAELERLDLDARPVEARHISGAMSMADRQRVLARLKDSEQPTVVTNARCLTEGIDVPALGAVAFVDPRSAPVDIVQAVGRVMRIAEGKRFGHVVVPVFLREEQLDDPEAAIESSAFQPVLAVLRAWRAHDPELVSDATRVATTLGRRDVVAGGYIGEHIQVLGVDLGVGGFERALERRFVTVSADGFAMGMSHLMGFVAEHRHARPLTQHVTGDGFRLGFWVSGRRFDHRRGRLALGGRLALERAAQLESLPGWPWSTHKDDWADGPVRLRVFADVNGHARPPSNYVKDDGYRLGSWVGRARHSRAELSAERVRDLDALPGWTWLPYRHAWQKGIEHLRAFAEENGHARPPAQYVSPDGFGLGRWVDRQVQAHKRGDLAIRRVADLQALPGWSWDARDAVWQEGLEHLREYADKTGHARPGYGHTTDDGFRFGQWVSGRRQDHRKRRLTPERISDLEAFPGWVWNRREHAWHEGLERLRLHATETGQSRLSQGYVTEDGYRLGQWVQVQRSFHKKDRLSPERAKYLESLPGWSWDPYEDDWREGLQRLMAYAAAEGAARPARSYVAEDGFRLGEWVHRRRGQHARRRLPEDRVAQLEALPGWSWKAR